MVKKNRGKPVKTIWAYAYQIVPPQTEQGLRTIKVLLKREHSDARGEERTWVGRLVYDPSITHILVVSDSPELDLDVNRRLEAQLKMLKATFLITAPLAVPDPAGVRPGRVSSSTH